MADVVALLLLSSVGFCFHLLFSQDFLMEAGAVIVV
jgi:hypothetical protein